MMLTIKDIREVGQIAANCDKEKLKIAINEAFEFDLKPLIACYFIDLKIHWDDEEGIWFDIIEPKEFDSDCVSCGYHSGLKKVLSYFTYARYLILNEFNDTPNGNVAKANNFSMPTDTRLLKDRADAYREMGKESFKEVSDYMIANRSVYPKFYSESTTAKGYGFKIKNIRL